MYTKEQLESFTPESVLQELKDGHWRFRNEEPKNRDLHDERKESTMGQHPIALIHSCIDSRIPVEILFDQGIGDIFVSRIAGNVENEDVIAGMEIACRDFGAKLILVMGHEDCGAIKAVSDHHDSPELKHLFKKISCAIQEVREKDGMDEGGKINFHEVALKNVELTIERIRQSSDVLRKMEEQGKIIITGAYYSIVDGFITFL